jgi:hypothetical protein
MQWLQWRAIGGHGSFTLRQETGKPEIEEAGAP